MGITFESLALKDELLQAVAELGFKEAMPIQAQAIPVLLGDDAPDFIGLAQTGTGKTCAYGLPLLQRVDREAKVPQVLILSPTRELCVQITDELIKFSRHLKGLQVLAVYGGAGIVGQINRLRKGVQVVVATPGRLLDLLRREALSLSDIEIVVLDEADEMLNMGFQEDLDAILNQVPDSAKTWLFSATMPAGVAKISQKYLTNPVEVTVGNRNEAASNITHQAYRIQDRRRYESLRRIIDFTPDMFGLVFCRTRTDTQELSEKLMHDGCYAEALHGDLSQSQRDTVMRKFRSHAVKILVATDVAARGLDVDDVTHVIHYHLPDDAAVYTHRSGRTARAGKSGKSIVLAGARELRRMDEIERRNRIRFEVCQVPDGESIQKRHLQSLVEELLEAKPEGRDLIRQELPQVMIALDLLSKEDVVARMMDVRLRPLMEEYTNAPDLNPQVKPRLERSPRKHSDTPVGGGRAAFDNNREMQRIMLNMGRLDRIREGAIVRVACEFGGIQSSDIGAIDIKREFSFFDVDKRVADRVLMGLASAELDGRLLEVMPVDSLQPMRSERRGGGKRPPQSREGDFRRKSASSDQRGDPAKRKTGKKSSPKFYEKHTKAFGQQSKSRKDKGDSGKSKRG